MAESDSAPVAPPQSGAEPPVEPPAPTPPTEAAPATPPPASPSPPPKPDYARIRLQERIDRLTAEKKQRDEEIARLKAGQGASEAELEKRIAEEAARRAGSQAQQIAAWNEFTSKVNEAVAAGQKEYGAATFDKAVAGLKTLHDPNDNEGHLRYINMIQAILDTGEAPKLIATLGEDTNEAARIMGMSATRMGVELGRLAAKAAPEPVSGAPKPITPITGNTRSHVPVSAEDTERADALDKRVWMERRNAHVAEVNKKAGRRVLM